jgi:hypothetical protein
MSRKPLFSLLSVFTLASFGSAACSASADPQSSQDPASVETSQEAELRKSITSCSVDSDCVAVDRGGCCQDGSMDAVNKHHTTAYANSTKCKISPRPICGGVVFVPEMRVAQCDTAKGQCKMVAVADIACGGFMSNAHACPTGYACSHSGVNPDVGGGCVIDTPSILGSWGASGAVLTATEGHVELDFGCGGYASIDDFSWSSSSVFTGTYTAVTSVEPAPGARTQGQPASFTGDLSSDGKTLSLTMISGTTLSSYILTKDKQVDLVRCF